MVEVVGAVLGGEVFLEGLLESLDFSAGGGVVGCGVLLFDAEVSEAGLEGVSAAFPAGEAGGVDHGVVGERGRGKAALRILAGSDGVEESPVELLCQLEGRICCLRSSWRHFQTRSEMRRLRDRMASRLFLPRSRQRW